MVPLRLVGSLEGNPNFLYLGFVLRLLFGQPLCYYDPLLSNLSGADVWLLPWVLRNLIGQNCVDVRLLPWVLSNLIGQNCTSIKSVLFSFCALVYFHWQFTTTKTVFTFTVNTKHSKIIATLNLLQCASENMRKVVVNFTSSYWSTCFNELLKSTINNNICRFTNVTLRTKIATWLETDLKGW